MNKLVIESNVFNDLLNINNKCILVDAQTLKYDTLENAIKILENKQNEHSILHKVRSLECNNNIEKFSEILENVELNQILIDYYKERIQEQKNILNLSKDILNTYNKDLESFQNRLNKVIELSKLIEIKE